MLCEMSERHSFKKLEKIVWKAVIRDCVLSLVMFCIYFSGLDDEIESMFSTSADVTNLVE